MLGTVLVGVALLTVAFNVVLHAQLESDVNDVLGARAAAQIGALSTTDGRLAVAEAPDAAAVDSQVWVFAGRRALEHPQGAAAGVDSAAARLAGGSRRTIDVASPATRLLAEPVSEGGRRLGTVVVAASRSASERTERTALVASLVLAAGLIVAAGLIARWLLGAALRPVARMTRDAAEWSDSDLDRRFALGPPTDELTRLAATLDGLLDRVSSGMRREQRLSSELSHELRTPLARISTQAQLLAGSPELPGPLREEARGIVRAAGQMAEVIDVLMTGARAEAAGSGGSADPVAAVRAVVDAAVPAAAARGVELELVAGAGGVRVTAEPKLVERILAPLVENACRHARSHAVVSVARQGPWVEVVVDDDGAGIRPEERTRIFDPGYRGSPGGGPHDGAGLGLPLARRLARSAGGDVDAEDSAHGGRFLVRLPATGPGIAE
ncbi:MAG: two-component system, OmpR family, sensor kinase [Thermoleophilaceae bacterium]|nr:two-component system, OmpR family, sensor kinase [Thermoleophilaceae bacterium]